MNKYTEHEMKKRRRRSEVSENHSNVNIGFIKINTIGKACRFTASTSKLVNINHTIRKTQGFGEHNSDYGLFVAPISGVDDADLVDSPSEYAQPYIVERKSHGSNRTD